MAFQQFGRTKSVAKRSKKYLEEALYVRLYKDGSSELSVRQQLNQFIKSNKRVYKWEVGDTLKKLRHRELYYPAFKIHLPKFPLFVKAISCSVCSWELGFI
ncbi:pentatricopeptide repeat-containing protein [Tripterygium wilfordii]|uniref:Pentatricopeptide repeat-containing protein n=1 Tax=Tripterygium wilfordii TaxID=458696 RepID=A0A7J7DJP0_TRIWF|nr:pentatricopeptide repeat-containing protein [Tripterygium wilfordii]